MTSKTSDKFLRLTEKARWRRAGKGTKVKEAHNKASSISTAGETGEITRQVIEVPTDDHDDDEASVETPRSTISAVMGRGAATEQESVTREATAEFKKEKQHKSASKKNKNKNKKERRQQRRTGDEDSPAAPAQYPFTMRSSPMMVYSPVQHPFTMQPSPMMMYPPVQLPFPPMTPYGPPTPYAPTFTQYMAPTTPRMGITASQPDTITKRKERIEAEYEKCRGVWFGRLPEPTTNVRHVMDDPEVSLGATHTGVPQVVSRAKVTSMKAEIDQVVARDEPASPQQIMWRVPVARSSVEGGRRPRSKSLPSVLVEEEEESITASPRMSAMPAPLAIHREDAADVVVAPGPELADRMWALEHQVRGLHQELVNKHHAIDQKLDRIMATMEGEEKKPAPLPTHRPRQREIRWNLTGLPPHIPFGGMGGMDMNARAGFDQWYEDARRQ